MWRFQIFVISTPTYLGMIQFDEHIFQMGWNHQLGTKQKVVGSQNLTLEATISSWKQTSFFSTGHWVELWWSAYQSLWEKTTMVEETWLSALSFRLKQCPTPVFECWNLFEKIKHIKPLKTRGFLLGYPDCRFFTVFTAFFFTVGPCGGVASALYGSLQYPGAKPGTTRGRFGDPKNIPTLSNFPICPVWNSG